MSARKNTSHILQRSIESAIHVIRGQRIILDSDLAKLYGIPTKVFNQAIKRNHDRFPEDFMFRLNKREFAKVLLLRSQIVTSKNSRGGAKYLPFAFTEHGAVMAANVLHSSSAIKISVLVVRAFIRMKSVFVGQQELAAELAGLEKKLSGRLDIHETAIVDILRRIMDLVDPPPAPPSPEKPQIGFHV